MPPFWAVVVAQFVERLLPIPEVLSLNPVIGKFYIEHLFTVNWIEKMKIKKKEAWSAPIKKGPPLFILITKDCESLLYHSKRQNTINYSI